MFAKSQDFALLSYWKWIKSVRLLDRPVEFHDLRKQAVRISGEPHRRIGAKVLIQGARFSRPV